MVKEGVEAAFAGGREHLETADIQDAIRNTTSLKELMGKSLSELEQEYEKRKYKNASIK